MAAAISLEQHQHYVKVLEAASVDYPPSLHQLYSLAETTWRTTKERLQSLFTKLHGENLERARDWDRERVRAMTFQGRQGWDTFCRNVAACVSTSNRGYRDERSQITHAYLENVLKIKLDVIRMRKEGQGEFFIIEWERDQLATLDDRLFALEEKVRDKCREWLKSNEIDVARKYHDNVAILKQMDTASIQAKMQEYSTLAEFASPPLAHSSTPPLPPRPRSSSSSSESADTDDMTTVAASSPKASYLLAEDCDHFSITGGLSDDIAETLLETSAVEKENNPVRIYAIRSDPRQQGLKRFKSDDSDDEEDSSEPAQQSHEVGRWTHERTTQSSHPTHVPYVNEERSDCKSQECIVIMDDNEDDDVVTSSRLT